MDITYREILGFVSTVCGLVGLVIYINSIRAGLTKPHCFSWLVWGLLMIIGFFAQISDDAGPGSWVTGTCAVGCILIAAYGYFKGERNITRSDWIAFIAALCAIPIWYFTKDPLFAVLLICAIDTTAFYPTFRKSWSKPFEESLLTYAVSCLTFILSMAALNSLTLITTLYPATLVGTNFAFIIMALARRGLVPQNG